MATRYQRGMPRPTMRKTSGGLERPWSVLRRRLPREDHDKIHPNTTSARDDRACQGDRLMPVRTLAVSAVLCLALGCSGSHGGTPGAGFVTPPKPLISDHVPAFASGSLTSNVGPDKANDGDPTTTWVSDHMPAWIAYDLSSSTAAQRQQVLVAWYDPRTYDYFNNPPTSAIGLPADYTI